MVKRRDGQDHFCVDYMTLNKNPEVPDFGLKLSGLQLRDQLSLRDPDEGVPLPQVDGYHIEAVDPAYVETSFNGGDREYKKPPPTPDKADLPRVNLVRKPMAYAAAPLAEEEEEFPSPSEAAYFQRLRSSKDEYQPKASQKDGHMEYEMQPLNSEENAQHESTNNSSLRHIRVEPTVDSLPPDARRAEEGGRPEEHEIDYECSMLGPLNDVGTVAAHFFIRQWHSLHRLTGAKTLVLGLIIAAIMGLLLAIGLFSGSFRYIEYYQMALKKSRISGVVDRSTTYLPGCYILGPDTELIFFKGDAHNVDIRTSIFTRDDLIINIDFHLQYFLKPDELGVLHSKFETDYNPVLVKIIESTVKNEAAQFSVDNYRLNRTYLEQFFFRAVHRVLGGNCCPSCCSKSCPGDLQCVNCQPLGSCDPAYHVDVRYFQMSQIEVPNEVFEQFLRQTLLVVENEKAILTQEHDVVVKETERLVQAIHNEAAVIRQNGTAQASLIRARAEADYELITQPVYAKALKSMFSHLNIKQMDQQLSLMLIRTLDEKKDSLYRGYAYDVYKSFSP
ncbi:hypothetical protein ScPMuIL_016941 [Solemya velum]